MKYEEAIKLRNKNLNLIGTTDDKGFIIGEILIVPSNEKLRNDFFVKYLLHKDANNAITPYLNEDMEVWSIDTKHLQDANILFYNKL